MVRPTVSSEDNNGENDDEADQDWDPKDVISVSSDDTTGECDNNADQDCNPEDVISVSSTDNNGSEAPKAAVDLNAKDGEAPIDNHAKDGKASIDNNPKDGEAPVDNNPKDGEAPIDNNPKDGEAPVDNNPKDREAPIDNNPKDREAPVDNNSDDRDEAEIRKGEFAMVVGTRDMYKTIFVQKSIKGFLKIENSTANTHDFDVIGRDNKVYEFTLSREKGGSYRFRDGWSDYREEHDIGVGDIVVLSWQDPQTLTLNSRVIKSKKKSSKPKKKSTKPQRESAKPQRESTKPKKKVPDDDSRADFIRKFAAELGKYAHTYTAPTELVHYPEVLKRRMRQAEGESLKNDEAQ